MATAISDDTEAAVFAAPTPQAVASLRPTPREWHRLTPPTVTFASQDAMRFGPRAYTPEQDLVISRAVAERKELSAPKLRRG